MEKLLHPTTCTHRDNFDAIMAEIQLLGVGVVVDEKAALDGVQVHLVHIDGGEQVLEHGGHELHVHAVGTKAVEHQERWMGKLLLMHAVPA